MRCRRLCVVSRIGDLRWIYSAHSRIQSQCTLEASRSKPSGKYFIVRLTSMLILFQITLSSDLVAVDALTGTMTIDWAFTADTACDSTKVPPCPALNPNATAEIFFDAYVL
jgi:hypothetical protein